VLDSFPWGESLATLASGDVLVLYSDGVTECPYKNDMYDEERWRAAVLAQVARGVSARAMAEALLAGLREYAHGVISTDDVTIVVVRALPAG
jgi:serine phosphatase RsbU (regulator of sigma subunit)